MSRRDDFEWNDNPTVVVRRQEAVAVYSNPDGDLVIRREREWNEDDDSFVFTPRASARRVIEALERLLLPEEKP